jgi:hypothetical protein
MKSQTVAKYLSRVVDTLDEDDAQQVRNLYRSVVATTISSRRGDQKERRGEILVDAASPKVKFNSKTLKYK